MTGDVDVDALRARVSPELLDEWMAYDQLEPIGDDWIVATLARVGAFLIASWGGDVKPSELIPQAESAEQTDASETDGALNSPNQQVAQFKMYAADQGWQVK